MHTRKQNTNMENQSTKVTVTHEDFLKSSKNFLNPSNCPMATAIKRVFNATHVKAAPTFAIINDKQYRVSQGYFGCDSFDQVSRGEEVTIYLKPV